MGSTVAALDSGRGQGLSSHVLAQLPETRLCLKHRSHQQLEAGDMLQSHLQVEMTGGGMNYVMQVLISQCQGGLAELALCWLCPSREQVWSKRLLPARSPGTPYLLLT